MALVLCAGQAARAAVTFTPAQQEAANKLQAKGGLVMQLAADSDALVVNLSLAGKQITDAEVALVKELPKVAQLNLANTAVTDSGLAPLAGLADLTMLHLEKTGVTDAGLAHVKGLAKLEYLNLYGTAVTDAGLANLSGLKGLKRVYLWQTKVTDAGVAKLKKDVAGVVVNRGEELAIVVKTPDPTPATPAAGGTAAAAAGKAINTVCPVSGKPVDATKTLAFEGKTIGFCCDNCPKTFQKDPKKFASKIKADAAPAAVPATPAKPGEKKPDDKKKPAAAPAAAANEKCPVSGQPVDASVTVAFEGKTVGFCCDNCKGKFEAEPKKFAKKI